MRLRIHRLIFAASGILLLLPALVSTAAEKGAADHEAVEARLRESVKYLSSDELEGRGIGAKGLDAAAAYLADQFAKLGLKVDLYDGTAFQKFKMTTGAKLGPKNELKFVGPPAKEGAAAQDVVLKVGTDFNPLAIGGSGKFDLPLVLAGYGITGKTEEYDDYAGVDVKDKAVIVLRHEPQQANPHSVFNGASHSEHAPFFRKVSNAYEHGAAAVIFVTDDYDIDKNVAHFQKLWQKSVDDLGQETAKFKEIAQPTAEELEKRQKAVEAAADQIKSFIKQERAAVDPLLGFDGAGSDSEGRNFPVLYCRRSVIDTLIKASLGKDLADIEKQIDRDLKPQSQELKAWRAVGDVTVERQEADVKNVLAVLAGEGPHADETIVIGAHYDHLGMGGANSAAPGVREIHNGADDNASGTAALVEIARELAARPEKPRRRIVFIGFTGEERGLIGSARYVRNPLFPLDKTVAMLNLDMVGRLSDDKLVIYGAGTATQFDPLITRLSKDLGFQLTKKPEGFGPSDHSSFYAQKIPVLHFFTGSHSDYHRPTDDFEKLNIPGMRRVVDLVVNTAVELAQAEDRPSYLEVKSQAKIGGGGDRPYFGSIPDFSQDQPGYALSGVAKDSPAARGGLRAGDIIIQFGPSKIGNLEDFDSALRKFKAGEKAPVVVKRGSEEVKLEVVLDPPRN